MSRRVGLSGVLLGTAMILAACQPPGGGDSGPSPRGRSTRDGVFTAQQAQYGAAVFSGSCAKCHSRTEWADASFLRSWSGRSVSDLFARIYETMPRGAPGSLSLQEYADVVAYLLSLSHLPPGTAELGTADEELRTIRIEVPVAR